MCIKKTETKSELQISKRGLKMPSSPIRKLMPLVYREFIYTGSPYISAMHLEGIEDNVILIYSVSKRYIEYGIRIRALVTKNEEVRKTVMKFCQARLSPPLLGQLVAEASIDGTEQYSRKV